MSNLCVRTESDPYPLCEISLHNHCACTSRFLFPIFFPLFTITSSAVPDLSGFVSCQVLMNSYSFIAIDSARLVSSAVVTVWYMNIPQVNLRAELSTCALFNDWSTLRSNSLHTEAEDTKLEISKDIGQILLEYLIQSTTQKQNAALTFMMLNSDDCDMIFCKVLRPAVHHGAWISDLQYFRQQISRQMSFQGNKIHSFISLNTYVYMKYIIEVFSEKHIYIIRN